MSKEVISPTGFAEPGDLLDDVHQQNKDLLETLRKKYKSSVVGLVAKKRISVPITKGIVEE